MAEGLVNRVKRLVSGGLGSIVDAIEGGAPETVMKEAIREIDAALDEVRDDLGLVLADKHNATRRIADANARHEELSEKTRLALAEGREDLAEAAIARQIDIEAQMPVLEDALNEAGHRAAELEGYVAALSARRREMEDDLAAFLASRAAAAPSGAGASAAEPGAERRAERAASAFDRVLRGASGAPATAPADRETAAKLAELEKVARANRIRERLEAVKALAQDAG